jgi:voltage-gated potassium channel
VAATGHERSFWSLVAARFRVPLAFLAFSVAYGTIGYTVLEGWNPFDALYMTVTTLTTVGFRELHPLDTSGRIFTITLVLAGVFTLFIVIGVTAQIVAAGELGEPLRRRRMQRRIEELRDHYVICAYGRVGRAAAQEFRQQGVRFVVVEPQADLAPLLEEHGFPYLSADPSHESVLRQAGIDRAQGLVCAVDSDAINVYITLTGRVLNPELYIVARASNPESVKQLNRAGADRVVSPYALSGRRMASLALQPAVMEFFDVVAVAPDLRLEEIVVRPGSPLDGHTLDEVTNGRPELTVLAVKKTGERLMPSPDPGVRLSSGDLLVALGPVKALAELGG